MKELYAWPINDYRYYLAHYGVGHLGNPPGRGSGRYAYGSGNRRNSMVTDVLLWLTRKRRERIINSRKTPIDKTTGFHLRADNKPIEKDLKNVNPGFNRRLPQVSCNCVMCSFAAEARIRGYDVMAKETVKTKAGEAPVLEVFDNGKPRLFDDAQIFKYPSSNSPSDWQDFTFKDPDVEKQRIALAKIGRNKSYAKFVFNELSKEPDSRGLIGCSWGAGGGHEMCYDVKNGKVRIIDGQSNEILTKERDIIDLFSLSHVVTATRTDNLDFNLSELKKYVV